MCNLGETLQIQRIDPVKMDFTDKDFKKLLIDLGTNYSEIGRAIGISSWAVQLYFRGQLTNTRRRHQIRSFLNTKARAAGVRMPKFWSVTAAAS